MNGFFLSRDIVIFFASSFYGTAVGILGTAITFFHIKMRVFNVYLWHSKYSTHANELCIYDVCRHNVTKRFQFVD